MKKELYLPPELRVIELLLNRSVLILSTESSTIEDYYYEELDDE
jgi:hypothetical protein